MRFHLSLSAVVLTTLVLAGCNTMSEGEFKSGQSALAGSPSVKKIVISDCIASRKREPLAERQIYAALINVSVANYPQAFCKRLVNAYANGRLTYADVANVNSGTADNSRLIRILQGR